MMGYEEFLVKGLKPRNQKKKKIAIEFEGSIYFALTNKECKTTVQNYTLSFHISKEIENEMIYWALRTIKVF